MVTFMLSGMSEPIWNLLPIVAKRCPHIVPKNPELRSRLVNTSENLDTFVKSLRSSYSLLRLRKAGMDNDSEQFAVIPRYRLERIAVPTLVLHGTADTLVPLAQGQFVANTVPHARLITVDGGEHSLVLTHKEEILPVLINFLKSAH